MLSIDFKKTNKLQDNSLNQETKYKRRRTICKIEKKKRRLNIRRNSNTLKTNRQKCWNFVQAQIIRVYYECTQTGAVMRSCISLSMS